MRWTSERVSAFTKAVQDLVSAVGDVGAAVLRAYVAVQRLGAVATGRQPSTGEAAAQEPRLKE